MGQGKEELRSLLNQIQSIMGLSTAVSLGDNRLNPKEKGKDALSKCNLLLYRVYA